MNLVYPFVVQFLLWDRRWLTVWHFLSCSIRFFILMHSVMYFAMDKINYLVRSLSLTEVYNSYLWFSLFRSVYVLCRVSIRNYHLVLLMLPCSLQIIRMGWMTVLRLDRIVGRPVPLCWDTPVAHTIPPVHSYVVFYVPWNKVNANLQTNVHEHDSSH